MSSDIVSRKISMKQMCFTNNHNLNQTNDWLIGMTIHFVCYAGGFHSFLNITCASNFVFKKSIISCQYKEYELRKHARTENRRYCDPFVLTYQAERMPEQIRLKVCLL